MFKANSLHHISPHSSLSSHPSMLHIQPTKIAFSLVHDQQGHALRRYEFSLNDFNKEFHLFEWRKKIHHPIPRISQVRQYTDHQQKNMVEVLCEHININFVDLRLLKIQQIIYCLSQILLGYQEIQARLGFVCIQPKLMGLNAKGQILIWINENLLANYSENRKIVNEKQIVIKIIQILQSKAIDKNHLFFAELRKIEPKFKLILDFMMAFKNKHKLKIIPKISSDNHISVSQKMVSSNTFSTWAQINQFKPSNIEKSVIMETSGHIRPSQSQSQILAVNRAPSNQCSVARHNTSVRTSIMQKNVNETPTNTLTTSMHENSAPKVSFNYTQKRQDLTPKHSVFLRDYMSDKNLPLLCKIQSETNEIKEFTLEDKKPSSEAVPRRKKGSRNDRRIMQSYTISYIPSSDTIYLQNQLDLKRSTLSHVSHSTFKSISNVFELQVSQNKTSMTTNHRSAVSQSFQSVGKSSNDDEYCSRKNDMFNSNNSNPTTYSTIKSSFVENNTVKNAVSTVLGNYHEYQKPSSFNHQIPTVHNSNKRNDMYTFGGLIIPSSQEYNQELKHSTTLPSFANIEPVQKHSAFIHKPTLANQINTKSIEQLYNNLYLNSQKKSVIMDEGTYHLVLSPVKEQVHSRVKESFVIELQEGRDHEPLSHLRQQSDRSQYLRQQSDRSQHEFMTPNVGQGQAFDYNQWRGIKGLLNQSNVYELKESFHWGPEIRTPNNIKLELLDKFGRDIGKSILPCTPTLGQHSRTHSVYTIEEQANEFY